MEEKSSCNINLDSEPERELETETDHSHVLLRQKWTIENESVFNRAADSLALLSVYRYAKRIRKFLGWENFREKCDAEEKFYSENLSLSETHCSTDSQEEKIDLLEKFKKNFKEETGDIIPDHSLLNEELWFGDSRDLSLLLERDNFNSKNKSKANVNIDEESYSDICHSNCEHIERSSCHLDIKAFSDYLSENKNDLLKKLYHSDNSETVLIAPEKYCVHNNIPKEIFRTELILDIKNSITDQEELNSNLFDITLNNNENMETDYFHTTSLHSDGVIDAGLMLNDESEILQNEGKSASDKNGTSIENNEEHLREFTSGCSAKIDFDASVQKLERDIDLESKDESGNTGKISDIGKRDTEINKNMFKKELVKEREQNSFNFDRKMENSTGSQNIDVFHTTNSLPLHKEIVPSDNVKNYNNNVIENCKSNPKNLELDTPLEAYVQYTNSANKETHSKEINNEKENFHEYDEDTTCGLGIFKPRWLQPYATAKVYVILYSILGILHGSYYSYLVGTLSTLEKRFSFESKTSGLIMIADEITPLLLGMFIGYYASRAHRPRIMSLGMFFSAGCCFITSLPYFIYGTLQNVMLIDVKSDTGPEYCDSNSEAESCDPDRPQNLLAVSCLMFGSFLKGLGNIAYYAIGLAYLDDNSDKQNTPIYLAITFALRLLGPLLGFLMSSGFLKYYENPFYDPGFGPDDPRWIGAWWIGFLLQGILLVIFTVPIALFPRRLPNQKKISKAVNNPSEDSLKEMFRGLISALKRLGKNPIFILEIITTTMTIFGHFGHAIMLPKYMENQFRLSASEANLFSGAITIVCIIISVLLGGFLVWKFTPRIKVLLGGMIVSEVTLCIGYLVLMVPRCQSLEMQHFGMNEEGLILNSVCNNNCDCSTSSFTPFCGPDNKTLYFSPCYAGCTEDMTLSSLKTNKEFGNCSCVDHQQLEATISEGFCPDENCRNQTIAYLIILFILKTLSSIFTVAGTMILLRSVHPSDKSVALGTFETFICLFGFIPFPVVYGALVDSACLVWEKSCGETGNCWFYDMEKYTYLLHGTSAFFSSLAVVGFIGLYFFSHRVQDLYTEEGEAETDKYVDIKLDTVSGSVSKL